MPSAVLVEENDGKRTVRLAANIREETLPAEDGETAQPEWVYDEAVFDLPADRADTEEEIREDFDAWWAYGSQDEEEPLTLEERVEIIEELLMGGDL